MYKPKKNMMASPMSCVTMTMTVLMLGVMVAEIAAKPLAEGQVTVEKSVAIITPKNLQANDVGDSAIADQVGVESNLAVSKENI